MEYLDKVLGVKVTYENVEFKHLPNFIATTCSWPFMATHRMDRLRGQIGSPSLEKTTGGRLKQSKVLSRMDMEPIGGAMI